MCDETPYKLSQIILTYFVCIYCDAVSSDIFPCVICCIQFNTGTREWAVLSIKMLPLLINTNTSANSATLPVPRELFQICKKYSLQNPEEFRRLVSPLFCGFIVTMFPSCWRCKLAPDALLSTRNSQKLKPRQWPGKLHCSFSSCSFPG